MQRPILMTQKLYTLVVIVVECIQAERAKERLDAKWKLDGVAWLMKWLGMPDAAHQALYN
jgi:hypothetical protein